MADQRTVLAAEVFKSAVDRPAEERSAFLDEACGGDAELRHEVESLLKFNKTGDGFLEQPAIDITPFLQAALKPNQHVGSYKVISRIGSGGMGEVYLAQDEKLNRQVALKLVRFGIGGEETARHFRREAQILASLNHPNIAQLYGAEITPDGFSFLVMEYVEGIRIDKYCNDHRLPINDRLEMFRRVCGAVHYAHQRLIIHRDIKPANVLITEEGQPKLLDFGIAKLLDPGTSMAGEQTMTFAAAMTPEYASPEQVRGETMTTATDVYSLGVILYELLTGQRPYRISSRSPAEIARAITEQEPTRPSTAAARLASTNPQSAICNAKLLRGDLDNIVLKALRKEPGRRYVSIAEFSEDIRRHLANLTVTARPDTRSYRTRKFVVRHRTGVAAVGFIAIALVAGVVATSWQARVALAERARAQLEFDDVRKLATSFLFEFNNSIQSLPGATPARKLLVQRALEYLSKLAQQSRRDPDLQRELAEAYLKVGDLQGNPYEPNLGDTHGAEESYEKALAISTALIQADGNDLQARRYLARSYQSIGEVLPLLGKPHDGVTDLRKAAEVFEMLVSRAPQDKGLKVQLANCYQSIGDLQGHSGLQNLGDRAGALESYRKGMAIFDAMAAEDSTDQKARGGAAVMRIRIADMQQARGDLDIALENYRGALERAQSLAAADPQNDRFRRILALSYRKMGDLESQKGNYQQALQNARKALELNQTLAAADPHNAQAANNYALSLTTVADLLKKTGDLEGSLTTYRQAAAILGERATAASPDLFMQGQLSQTLLSIGAVLGEQKNLAEARSATSRGLSIARDLANRASATPDELSQYALALLTCSPADLREPATALQKAREAVEKSAERDPKSLDILAQAYFQTGDSAGAIEAEKKALNLLPPPGQNPLPLRQKFEAQLAGYQTGTHSP